MNIASLPIIATTAILSLGSCALINPKSAQKADSKIETRYTTNIKVLNEVQCKWKSCSEKEKTRIRESCLSDGYIIKLYASQIISARSIKELTKKTYEYTELEPIEIVDDNGVVGITQTLHPRKKTKTIEGYCIGSEYIVNDSPPSIN